MRGEARTHRWVNVVDELNCLFDVAPLHGFSDVHSGFNGAEVDGVLKPGLFTELFCGRFVALDNKVVHHEFIKVPSEVEQR